MADTGKPATKAEIKKEMEPVIHEANVKLNVLAREVIVRRKEYEIYGPMVDRVYLDNDGDVCLESNEYDDNDFSAQELLDELDRYSDKRYVYVYNDDIDTSFDIDEEDDDDDYDDLWYIGNGGNLYIDMSYEEDN